MFINACCLLSALPSLSQFGGGRLSPVAISFYTLSLLFGPCRLSEFTLTGLLLRFHCIGSISAALWVLPEKRDLFSGGAQAHFPNSSLWTGGLIIHGVGVIENRVSILDSIRLSRGSRIECQLTFEWYCMSLQGLKKCLEKKAPLDDSKRILHCRYFCM